MSGVDYVLDSSCLMKLNRDQPVDLYPSVWERVEELLVGGRAVLPKEAKREIDKKDDVLHDWVKSRPSIVTDETEQDLAVVADISRRPTSAALTPCGCRELRTPLIRSSSRLRSALERSS